MKTPHLKTPNYNLALILYGAGMTYVDAVWDKHKGRADFIFENRTQCEIVIRKHRQGVLQLDSQLVIAAIGDLKNSLFNK